MKIKRVRITAAAFPTFWYANKVGEEYMVEASAEKNFGYKVIPVGTHQSSLHKYIHEEDCEVVEEFNGFIKEILTTSIIRVDDQPGEIS